MRGHRELHVARGTRGTPAWLVGTNAVALEQKTMTASTAGRTRIAIAARGVDLGKTYVIVNEPGNIPREHLPGCLLGAVRTNI